MAAAGARRKRGLATRRKRSRTTSDLERWFSRDSASISAAKASGNRTVSVFMGSIVIGHANHERQNRAGYTRDAPDRFNGTIEPVHVKYVTAK